MKSPKLKSGQIIKIAKGHKSGLGGRHGKIVEVSMYDGQGKARGALVDIDEPLQVIIEPESLEPLQSNSLPPGWIEFYI